MVIDEEWMKQVLRLAERGRGRTSPNPMVGAILVREGKRVGQGYHTKAGEAHAEIVALDQARQEAKGATLYVNLEPCTHYGKTPPCAPRVIESGVRRVVVGTEDPNPLVKGKGIESLIRSGVTVQVGVLEKECQRLNEAFFKYIVTKEPYVILKSASTLDGRISTRTRDSKWITGEVSRRFVHRLRNAVDGVLVGIETILNDNPLLTSRIRGGRDPYRIILDSRLRIPEDAKVFGESPSRVIIGTTEAGAGEKMNRLKKKGVQILVLPAKQERVDLKACLKKLGEMEIVTLLVEGGSEINGSFFDARLLDKFCLFLSPKWIGDREAPGIFGGQGVKDLKEAVTLKEVRLRKMGEDFLLEGYVDWRDGCSQES